MLTLIEWGWIVTTLISLLFGAYFDIRVRLIPDKIWLFQLVFGILFTVLWYVQNQSLLNLISIISSILISTFFAFIIIFTGAMGFGDAKAFFCFGFSFPILIIITDPMVNFNQLVPPIVYLFVYFGLINLGIGILFFMLNIYRLITGNQLFFEVQGTFLQKIAVLFEGIQISIKEVEAWKHFNIAEKFIENSWIIHTPRFEVQLTDEEYEIKEQKEKEEAIINMELTSKQYLWVRPQMPGIVYILVGFIILLIFGPTIGRFIFP